jgi:hypothetical protein
MLNGHCKRERISRDKRLAVARLRKRKVERRVVDPEGDSSRASKENSDGCL